MNSYLGAGGSAAGGTAAGVLASTGSEFSLLWVTLAVLLIAAGIAFMAIAKRRKKHDRLISGAI